MFKRFFIGLFVFVLMGSLCINVYAGNDGDREISNGYFSFTMPEKTRGIYTVSKMDNGIYIIEKYSERLGAGGFAFGIKIYESPEEYANEDGYKKIGEFIDKSGKLYDMVLIQPVEIRYGDGQIIADNYKQLYNLAENLEIKGVNGNVYNKNQGMKGEDLYGEVLKKYKKALEKKWDSSQCEKEGLGCIYNFSEGKNKRSSKKVGYKYYDLNSDGIDELFVGEITKDNKNGRIYDIYTMVNRKPVHVARGEKNTKYYVCDEMFLCREQIDSNDKSFLIYSLLEKNSAKLNLYSQYMYNSDKNKSNPWFKYNRAVDDYETISEEDYNREKSECDKCIKFDYIPLSDIK